MQRPLLLLLPLAWRRRSSTAAVGAELLALRIVLVLLDRPAGAALVDPLRPRTGRCARGARVALAEPFTRRLGVHVRGEVRGGALSRAAEGQGGSSGRPCRRPRTWRPRRVSGGRLLRAGPVLAGSAPSGGVGSLGGRVLRCGGGAAWTSAFFFSNSWTVAGCWKRSKSSAAAGGSSAGRRGGGGWGSARHGLYFRRFRCFSPFGFDFATFGPDGEKWET